MLLVEYFHLTEVQERDMFQVFFASHILLLAEWLADHFPLQRVQMGMPLKEGEKLQSLAGPWAAWILALVKRYVEGKGMLDEELDWETGRGAAFQSITCVVRFMLHDSSLLGC